jgi:hypothetical protein
LPIFLVHRSSLHGDAALMKNYDPIPRLPTPPLLKEMKMLQREKRAKLDDGMMMVACEFCFFECCEKNLQKHINSQHGERNGNAEFLCDICSKEFYTLSGFKRHAPTHDTSLIYHCDLCGWQSTRKSSLEYHIKSHHLHMSVKKKYPCQICQKKMYRMKIDHHMAQYHQNNYDCGAVSRYENFIKYF